VDKCIPLETQISSISCCNTDYCNGASHSNPRLSNPKLATVNPYLANPYRNPINKPYVPVNPNPPSSLDGLGDEVSAILKGQRVNPNPLQPNPVNPNPYVIPHNHNPYAGYSSAADLHVPSILCSMCSLLALHVLSLK